MATAVQKITLSSSRDIPFNKLVLSQANVRRVKAGVSVEELAESIARRGLIQSLHVRPVVDGEGKETGMFEVPAGGRRYRALELLVSSKRLNKTAPVPCVVSEAGGWRPTVENYLGRVTKARILEAVREGAGERAAQLIDHMKKGDMATEAERLLADTGWLPEPLRLDPDAESDAATSGEVEADDLPEFLAGDGDDEEPADDEDEARHMVAAE